MNSYLLFKTKFALLTPVLVKLGTYVHVQNSFRTPLYAQNMSK